MSVCCVKHAMARERRITARGLPMETKVPIIERGDRGFHGYGEPMTDTYGGLLEVYESSSASGPHVWLKVDASAWDHDRAHSKMYEAHAHLNEEQARALIARLQTWLDEIPSRWGR